MLSDSLGDTVRVFSLWTETILEPAKQIGILFWFFFLFVSSPSLFPSPFLSSVCDLSHCAGFRF